jgi:hypothetical protein
MNLSELPDFKQQERQEWAEIHPNIFQSAL